MFSIKRKEKVLMNFIGSPQCGNAGDMKFTVEVEGFGDKLDSQGFVFDSFHLFDLFKELQTGRWSGSCEGIGIFCAKWLFDKDPGVNFVEVTVTTESTNQLQIQIQRSEIYIFEGHAIKRIQK